MRLTASNGNFCFKKNARPRVPLSLKFACFSASNGITCVSTSDVLASNNEYTTPESSSGVSDMIPNVQIRFSPFLIWKCLTYVSTWAL